jgi:hypothetical protein
MIIIDAEADRSTLPLVPYEPSVVKRYGSSNRARARYRSRPRLPSFPQKPDYEHV